MRITHTLPLAAAVLLAACGSSETDADGDGELSAEEVAAAASDIVQPRPGEYRVSLELLEFDAPDMPEGAKQMAQDMFASGLSAVTYCLTEEEAAANGAEEMVQRQTGSDDCTTKRFDVSGGSVIAEMQCAMDGGVTSTVRMEGEMTTEGSTMTMDSAQQIPDAGETRTKMRVTTQRVGDCKA